MVKSRVIVEKLIRFTVISAVNLISLFVTVRTAHRIQKIKQEVDFRYDVEFLPFAYH